MTNFNAGYQPPGVYVETNSTGANTVVGVGTTVLCLVGNGIGYEINTDNVTFNTNTFALTKDYVNTSTIVVSAQTDSGKVTYALSTDYTVATADHVTTVTRLTGGTIPTDIVVQIAYQYADDDYYALNRYTDYPSLVAAYGPAVDSTSGAIVSPISQAANVAFVNGASVVYAVALDLRGAVDPTAPTTEETQAAFVTAYNKMIPNYEIDLLVPLWQEAIHNSNATSYLNDLSAFLNTAETEGFLFVSCVGLPQVYDTADPDVLAESVSNPRVILFWPQVLTFFNPVLNTGTTLIDGLYLAAAAAGVIAVQPNNQALTRSPISGFTGIPAATLNSMTTTKKNGWSSSGVSVAELDRNSNLVIRHGVTTDEGNIGTSEISIVRCQDIILQTIQLNLEAADLIGSPITSSSSSITTVIAGLVIGVLEGLLADGTLFSYTTPIVTQSPGPGNNPTLVQVTFSYQPTYPLDYIQVAFTLDLTTATFANTTPTTS